MPFIQSKQYWHIKINKCCVWLPSLIITQHPYCRGNGSALAYDYRAHQNGSGCLMFCGVPNYLAIGTYCWVIIFKARGNKIRYDGMADYEAQFFERQYLITRCWAALKLLNSCFVFLKIWSSTLLKIINLNSKTQKV